MESSPFHRNRAAAFTIAITCVATVLFAWNAESMAQSARNGVGTRAGQLAAPQRQPAGQPRQPVTAPQPNRPVAANPQQPAKESCNLTSSHKPGAADVVEISLEAHGQVIQTLQSGKQESATMEVAAGFKYEERFDKYTPNGPARTIRQYEKAGMKRKIGANTALPKLDKSRKFVVSEYDGKKTQLYSLGGAMRDEQYALLHELPFNTTMLDLLLPNREVKLGEDWRLSNDAVVALLGVDAIENNTIHLSVTSIADNFAEVELYQIGDKDKDGKDGPSTLECAAEGASVSLDMEGKYQFDLNSRRITWFGINISERRSQSVATPGLDWNATLKINIAPLEKPDKLSDETIASMKLDPTDELLKLYYNAHKGPWKFQHSRKWKMIEDGAKITSLCYLDGGEAIAQCNILSNGKIDLTTKPSLAGYKEQIQKGLGERFVEFKEQAEYDGAGGVSVYYVVADGVYEESPFRWVYYLVTDKNGAQATIMFELRADLLEQYDDSGNEIVESFKLVPRSNEGVGQELQRAAGTAAKK